MPSSHKGRDQLQMHTVVDQPLTADSTGRISCRPIGQDPIVFQWIGPNGDSVKVDDTGSEALEVTPGRYRIVATDASDARADVVIDVEPLAPTAVVIREYRVTHASTRRSRDGSVEAVGVGLDRKWRYLWTHGVETEGPMLRDVPAGLYAAIPVAPTPLDDPPMLIHECPPAKVDVASVQ